MEIRSTLVGKVGKIQSKKYADDKRDTKESNFVWFTLSVRTNHKHPDGHPRAGQPIYHFINTKAFGALADLILEYVNEGDKVTFFGSFRPGVREKEIDVPVKTAAGTKSIKVKIKDWPTFDFYVEDFDAPMKRSTPVDAGALSEIDDDLLDDGEVIEVNSYTPKEDSTSPVSLDALSSVGVNMEADTPF